MKKNENIIILGDLHFDISSGIKADRLALHQQLFLDNVLFPYIEKNNIKTLIQTGDLFDNRLKISTKAIEFSKRVFFDKLLDLGVTTHILAGNHDLYYKDSLKIVTANQVLREYDNIVVYDKITSVDINGHSYTMIPWVCKENEQEIVDFIKKDKSEIAIAHLELVGYQMSKNQVAEDGMSADIFKKYRTVYSGHYHTPSTKDNIVYVGTPYQLTKVDAPDTKHFAVITHETEQYVVNPYTLFDRYVVNDKKELKSLLSEDHDRKYVDIHINYEISPKELGKFSDEMTTNYDIYDLKLVQMFSKDEATNIAVDTSSIKNNADLIKQYSVANELKTEVARKLDMLYNEAVS
jgi:DNA repair exonuclease SbcCD nuclease subunit